ncbi:hypothetical protein Tco_0217384 [Tanacetum coccineum]
MGQSTQTLHMLTKPQVFYDECHKTVLGYQNPLYLSQAQRKVPALYSGQTIVKKHDALSVMDTEETLILAEESRLKMHAKQNDPIVKDKKVNIAPIDYAALNKLDLGGLNIFGEAYEKVVKPFVKTLKEYFHMFDQSLAKEITDMKEVFTQMETKVDRCSVKRKCFEIKEKELLLANDRLLELLISQDLVHTVVNSLAAIVDCQSMEKSYLDEYVKCVNLKVELSKNNQMVEKAVYNEHLKRCARMEIDVFLLKSKYNNSKKGNSVSEYDKSKTISKVIALGMYKLDLVPLSPKLLQNREAHVDYLKHTQEHADILCKIVKQARALKPLDSDLDSILIMEHLVKISIMTRNLELKRRHLKKLF